MNYISVLRDILKLNHDEIAAVSDDFESINAYLEAHQIIIPDDFQVTLCNHINVMLLRFKTNECAVETDGAVSGSHFVHHASGIVMGIGLGSEFWASFKAKP